jgi:hypothetical protein
MKTTFYNMELQVDEGPDDRAGEGAFDPLTTPYALRPEDFPANGSLADQFLFLLRYAVLAPSSHNSQPWRCALTDAGIGVYADYTRRLPVADPGNRELLMSIGAFLMNLRISAARFGFESRVDYNYSTGNERPIAFVRLVPRAPVERIASHLVPLFPAITTRHTNRHPFLLTRMSSGILDELRSIGRASDVGLMLSADGGLNMRVADLVSAADRQQHASAEYRRELAEWVRPNWTRKRDGITGEAFGISGVVSTLGPWATRTFDMGQTQAARDKNLCAQAPLLVVVHSEDTLPELLEAGEILERVWLTLVGRGLAVSFFNTLIAVPDLRLHLRSVLGLPSWPQLLLRVGYSLTEPVPSPRRSIQEILGAPGAVVT